MRVLVAYASQMGATKAIAERIGDTLRAHGLEAEVVPATDVHEPVRYDAFVIGSAIHGGHWLPAAAEFTRLHTALLKTRPVWLFSSGPVGEKYALSEQPEPREVAKLKRSIDPRGHTVFGGAFDRATADLGGLGLVERTVAKAFLPEGDFRDWPAIEAWAYSIVRELAPPARTTLRELQAAMR